MAAKSANIPAGTELPDDTLASSSVEAEPRFRFGVGRDREPGAAARPNSSTASPLPEDEGFAPGEIANATTVKRAGRLAVSTRGSKQGYAKAEVVEQRITAAHTERELMRR